MNYVTNNYVENIENGIQPWLYTIFKANICIKM